MFSCSKKILNKNFLIHMKIKNDWRSSHLEVVKKMLHSDIKSSSKGFIYVPELNSDQRPFVSMIEEDMEITEQLLD